MEPVICSETSVRNYRHLLRNISDDHRSYLEVICVKWQRVSNALHMPEGMSRGSDNRGGTFSLYWFLSLLGFLPIFCCGLDLSWGCVNLVRFRTILFVLFYNLVDFGYVLRCFWIGF